MASGKFYNEVLPFTALVAIECSSVGLSTLFKAASSEGLSYYVFVAYIYAISTVVLLPIPFIFCRKTKLPSRLFPLFWRILVLGSLSLLADLVGFKGVQYSSPTMSSSMNNLIPAFTFIFAIIFRMEKLAPSSSSFRAKLTGTTISIAGALVIILYEGPTIFPVPSSTPSTSLQWSLRSSQSDWIIGGILLFLRTLIFPLWYILLTNTMKIYPEELVVSFYHCLFMTILSIPVCLIAEPDLSAWRPTSTTALMSFIYSAFLGPAFIMVVHSWSLHLKGPVYVATFKPLSILIAVVTGLIFLGESLHLGSVIGAVILSAGVYAVIWGKAREQEMKGKGCSEISSNGQTPLLQSENV